MSALLEIDLAPGDRTLRQFGFLAFGAFGVLAAAARYEVLVFAGGLGALRPLLSALFAGLALYALLAAALRPRLVWALYVGLSLLAYPIGLVISHVIMGTLFYGLITPVGLIFRFLGRDSLRMRLEPERESYWMEPKRAESDEHYFKQF